MLFFNQYINEVIGTGIILFLVIGLRIITSKVIRKYAKTSEIIEHRTRLVIKYIHLLINILAPTVKLLGALVPVIVGNDVCQGCEPTATQVLLEFL